MLLPIIPETATKILSQIKASDSDFKSLEQFGFLKNNTQIETSTIVFKRIDLNTKLEEIKSFFDSKN